MSFIAAAAVVTAGAAVAGTVNAVKNANDAKEANENANRVAAEEAAKQTEALQKEADATKEAADKLTTDTNNSRNMPPMYTEELAHAIQSLANEQAIENRDKALPKDNTLLYFGIGLLVVLLITKKG